jgi:HlyD family secretion protein
VNAQSEGYLINKIVTEGDEVKAGDALFVIDSDQQAARYRIAKENYDIAKKNAAENSSAIKELKAALEVARSKMQYDSANFVRYTNLLNQNAIARVDYDRAKLAHENSQNDFLLQQSRYQKILDQLHLELANAESQLKIAGDESKRFTIRSQVDGMVFKTNKEQGELVRRGEVLAIVGMKDGFFLELNVDELDVQRVKQEQKVLVKIDAYPGKVFEAKVTQVYPLIDKRQQSARVDATLNEPLPGWFSGLALEANIVVREKENAIVIPKTALMPGDSVLIKTSNGDKKVYVTKGIETLDAVEITNGIDTSSQLIIEN